MLTVLTLSLQSVFDRIKQRNEWSRLDQSEYQALLNINAHAYYFASGICVASITKLGTLKTAGRLQKRTTSRRERMLEACRKSWQRREGPPVEGRCWEVK